ncbi:MFS family permease [Nocardiopsis arvandica]|uniref:MFS family permease n=1 Tax=Nocardiopsis sinuspersici TaxID=501010 RepID=A0A7Y9XFF0_9ACTN|nr:MFS transporter [Nocardiopsis sinuspersici]NYH54879.1 MFS family permease [Nocardiopsis sinuspersici]
MASPNTRDDVGGTPGTGGYRRVLAVGEFRVVFVAEVLAVLGQVAAQITLSLTVYERTGSPLLSALAFAASFVPYLIGATLLSAWSDRVPARRLMVVTQLTTALLIACMAPSGTPVPVVLALLLAMGAIAPLYQGTRAALVADILPADGFALGRSLLRMAAQTAQICGFAFGGVLLAATSPTAALLTGSGLLVLSSLLLWLGLAVRPARRSTPSSGGSPLGESVAGAGRVLRSPSLRPLLAFMWLLPALSVAPEALAAPIASGLGGGPVAVAALLSAAPVGMIVGGLLLGALLTDGQRVRAVVPLGLVTFVPLLGLALRPELPVVVALLAVSGCGYGYALGVDRLLIERVAVQDRGQVLTLVTAGLMILQGLGFAFAGALAEWLPPHTVVVLAAVLGLATTVGAGLRLTPARRRG